MLDIKKINNSVVVVSDSNIFYPNDNTNSYPLNSLMVVVDDSDMVIFKSASNGDVLFSALIEDLTINGSKTSKDTIFNDLDSVISAATGGGGGGGSVDAYTKAESDAKYATKEYAEEIAFNSGNDIKDEIGTYVSEISDYVDNGKINYIVKNIADGYSEPREIPFKTINGQNVLGEGNIEIQGGGGGSVDAYTKAESDAKYGTKAEQESLRGDVENALGEIAALGYDKADKKDVPTLQEGTVGTENNYIYADMSDYTKRVVADMYFKSDKDDVRLMFTPWGAEGPGPDYMTQMDILPEANESEAGIISSYTYKEFKNKQDKLTAGDGITIEDNVISAVGGGDVDLSNYPTKQEVNQTYLQKEGEYVKAVTANGGAINFEKGNGTPDVVNLKTVGGQSIIGMDDIPVPTVQTSFNGSSKNYIYASTADSKYNVVANIKPIQNLGGMYNSVTKWGETTGTMVANSKYPTATQESDGVMSKDDKKRLDATPNIHFATQSVYDGLQKDEGTLYFILEDVDTGDYL